jgi:dihydrofolate reductase
MSSSSARLFAARVFAGQSRASKTRTSKARASRESVSVSATRRAALLAGGASLATALAPIPAAASGAGAADLQTVVYVGLTIDGFLARPDGALDFLPTPSDPNEDFGFADFLASVDVVVMGRKTFDQVAAFVNDGVPWPYAGKPVYVVSRTMRQEDIPPETLAAARASDENKETKISVSAASPAETLRVVARETRKKKGSRPLRAYVDGGSIVRALLEEDLVDEMVLTTVPVLIGRGAPLFGFDTRTNANGASKNVSGGISGGDLRWDVAESTRYENDGLVKTRYVRRRR